MATGSTAAGSGRRTASGAPTCATSPTRPSAEIARGVVTGLEVAGGGRWEVTLEAGDAIAADGVVLTGAGPAITVPGQPRDHPRVLDGRTYWLAARELHRERALNLCVIGSGETAASVVIDLVKRCHKALGDRRADLPGRAVLAR